MANQALQATPLRLSLAALLLGLLLAGCAGSRYQPGPAAAGGEGGGSGDSKRRAYQIDGEWYYPRQQAAGYVEQGKASWYGGKFHGQRTANGEVYDMHLPTAAHRTLPLPTLVEVTNLENGRSTRVRVNDRGPFVDTHERIIDLSYAAAQRLDMDKQGVARVEVRTIAGPKMLAGMEGDGVSALPEGRNGNEPEADGSGEKPEAIETAIRPRPGRETLYLQVGAFSQRDNAARLKQRIRRTELGRVVVTTGRSGSGPVFRVRLGPLDSVLHADRLARQLRRQGIETGHIVRE